MHIWLWLPVYPVRLVFLRVSIPKHDAHIHIYTCTYILSENNVMIMCLALRCLAITFKKLMKERTPSCTIFVLSKTSTDQNKGKWLVHQLVWLYTCVVARFICAENRIKIFAS